MYRSLKTVSVIKSKRLRWSVHLFYPNIAIHSFNVTFISKISYFKNFSLRKKVEFALEIGHLPSGTRPNRCKVTNSLNARSVTEIRSHVLLECFISYVAALSALIDSQNFCMNHVAHNTVVKYHEI